MENAIIQEIFLDEKKLCIDTKMEVETCVLRIEIEDKSPARITDALRNFVSIIMPKEFSFSSE